MCHGFMAIKDSVSMRFGQLWSRRLPIAPFQHQQLLKIILDIFQGERLSHAVGCAFAICLERKQKRDSECKVSVTFDSENASFTRTGSFRQATITERLQDPQVCYFFGIVIK